MVKKIQVWQLPGGVIRFYPIGERTVISGELMGCLQAHGQPQQDAEAVHLDVNPESEPELTTGGGLVPVSRAAKFSRRSKQLAQQSFQLPVSLQLILIDLARRRCQSVSALIRDCLRESLGLVEPVTGSERPALTLVGGTSKPSLPL